MQPNTQENTQEIKNDQQQTAIGTKETNSSQPSEAQPSIKSEDNQANWRAFREQREADRKAREASDKRATEKAAEAEALKAALEAITNRPSNNRQMNESDSEDIAESEEQRIDRRVEAAIKQREVQYEKDRKVKETKDDQKRLIQTFPDYYTVLSPENCDYMDYHHPEITAPFDYMPDGYEKWVAMYKTAKKLIPNSDSKRDSDKADKNLQKPGSISRPGTTQGTGVMPSSRLTDERKAANYERMQRTLKGLN